MNNLFKEIAVKDILNKYPHLKNRKNVKVFKAIFPLDLESEDKKILTEDAFNKMDVKDMPVHFSPDSPYELPTSHINKDGEYIEIGHILGKNIIEENGIRFGEVDIIAHPVSQEKYIEILESKKEDLAPSWELDNYTYNPDGDKIEVLDGDFSGLAILGKKSAAFGIGKLLYAEKEKGEEKKMDVIEKDVKIKFDVDTSKLDKALLDKKELEKQEENKLAKELEELKKILDAEKAEKEKIANELAEKLNLIKEKDNAHLIEKRKNIIPKDFLETFKSEDEKKKLDALLLKLDDDEFRAFLTPKSTITESPDLLNKLNKENEPAKKSREEELKEIYGSNYGKNLSR